MRAARGASRIRRFLAAAPVRSGAGSEGRSSQAWSSTAAAPPSTRWRPFLRRNAPLAQPAGRLDRRQPLVDELDSLVRSRRRAPGRTCERAPPRAPPRPGDSSGSPTRKRSMFSAAGERTSSARSLLRLPPASGGRGWAIRPSSSETANPTRTFPRSRAATRIRRQGSSTGPGAPCADSGRIPPETG